MPKQTHTHTRTNRIPCECGICTSVKQDKISLRDLKNIEHTAAEEILRNHLSSSTPISRTTTSTGRQPNSSHLSTHGIPDASQRPSTFSSTTQFHKTLVSSSAIFGDPYYGPKDLLYPKSTTQPNPDRGISYILSQTTSPLCLSTTDSYQWTHTPPISVTSTISLPPTLFHGPKDLLYPKSTTQPRLMDLLYPKSTTLPRAC